MKFSRFLIFMLCAIVLASAANVGLAQWAKTAAYAQFGWWAIILLALLSTILYFLGLKALKSKDKVRFSQVFLGGTVAKMLLSALYIMVYAKISSPESGYFLLPFFCAYVIFTVFESYIMIQLGKSN